MAMSRNVRIGLSDANWKKFIRVFVPQPVVVWAIRANIFLTLSRCVSCLSRPGSLFLNAIFELLVHSNQDKARNNRVQGLVAWVL